MCMLLCWWRCALLAAAAVSPFVPRRQLSAAAVSTPLCTLCGCFCLPSPPCCLSFVIVEIIVMLCAASLTAGLACAALCATLSAEEVPWNLAMELNSGDAGARMCGV